MTELELRTQWELQKASQLSVRTYASSHLKKELDVILSLQGELEAVEMAIKATKQTLTTLSISEDAKKILKGLQEAHASFASRVEALYISLNIHNSYLDLKGANLNFVWTLLMAHDLKMNIRSKNQALGTKLHQQTYKGIAKQAPTLTTAIKKFNTYCAKLMDAYDPSWNIQLPLPLPTKLVDL
ncbi:hypothetical protein CPB84DRAFT_463891 [Gymnopilus junonius]|uniref:Uncharacterized protein n=1 Tax=Gymnopilus junonius TaxID=109634 RepID=A0A9P5P2L4_GYMJU|nr:hypothetical protein CPB84DRAFT_463891 [Gymnopilus junonius]